MRTAKKPVTRTTAVLRLRDDNGQVVESLRVAVKLVKSDDGTFSYKTVRERKRPWTLTFKTFTWLSGIDITIPELDALGFGPRPMRGIPSTMLARKDDRFTVYIPRVLLTIH